jgi:hypothetical protein
MQFLLFSHRGGLKPSGPEALAAALASLACAASVCVFAWMMAVLFWRLAGPAAEAAPLPPDLTATKHVARVNAQHPFGVAASSNSSDNSDAASDTDAGGWRLLATISGRDGGGVALLGRDDGTVKILQPGETLASGEQVLTIATNGIELSSAGGKRWLALAPFLSGNDSEIFGAGPGRRMGGAPPPGEIVNVYPPRTVSQ